MSTTKKTASQLFAEKIYSLTYGKDVKYQQVQYEELDKNLKYSETKHGKNQKQVAQRSVNAVSNYLLKSVAKFLKDNKYTTGLTEDQIKQALANLTKTQLFDFINDQGVVFQEEFPVFFPEFGLYGSINSIAGYITQNVADLSGKTSDQAKDDWLYSLYNKLVEFFTQAIMNQNRILVTVLDIFGNDGALSRSDIEFLCNPYVDNADVLKFLLENFVAKAFEKNFYEEMDNILLSELEGFERRDNVFSIESFVSSYKGKNVVEKDHLDIDSMIQLAALSGAISHFTFSNIPSSESKPAKKALKKNETDENKDENEESVPKHYDFCASMANQLEDFENAKQFVNYTHVFSFRPYSKMLKGKSEIQQERSSITYQMFRVFRSHAGFTKDGAEKKTGRSSAEPTLLSIINGNAKLGIDELGIGERGIIRGFTKSSLTGKPQNLVTVWSRVPPLTTGEKQKLVEFFMAQETKFSDFSENDEIKSLVMKFIYSNAVIKPSLHNGKNSKKETADDKQKRITEIQQFMDRISLELIEEEAPRASFAEQNNKSSGKSLLNMLSSTGISSPRSQAPGKNGVGSPTSLRNEEEEEY